MGLWKFIKQAMLWECPVTGMYPIDCPCPGCAEAAKGAKRAVAKAKQKQRKKRNKKKGR